MKYFLGVCVFFITSLIGRSASTCLLPSTLWSTSGWDTWVSSEMGSLNFTSTTILGWKVHTFGTFTLTCEISSGSQYVLRSNSFTYYNLPFEVFVCLELTEQTTIKYTYFQPTAKLSDAGYERVKIYLEGKTITSTSTICDVTDYSTIPYQLLLKSGSETSATITCPSMIQSYWNYTYDAGSGNSCGNETGLDVCSDTTKLVFDYTKCSEQQAYSSGGELYCMYSTTNGSTTYLNMYNLDSTTDESTTYRFMCYTMTQDNSTSTIYATQYPQFCPGGSNSTDITSPGAVLEFTLSSTCLIISTLSSSTRAIPTTVAPEVTDTTMATVAAVLAVFFVILIVVIVIAVIYYCHKRKKRLAEEERKRKEEEAERLRKEEEERERLRLEEGALTPRMDLGLPDDSIYDISRLMYDSDSLVSPSKVQPTVGEKLDRPFQGFDDDYMDIKKMMEDDGWLDARKRHDDVDEFEKGETRSQSAARRLKEMARKRKKLGKKGDESDDDMAKKNRKELIIDLMGTDYETDMDSDTERRRLRRDEYTLEDETDDAKVKKKRKKKRKMKAVYNAVKLNKIPLRKTLRKKKIDPEYVIENGEIQLPLYRDDPKLKHLPPLQRVNRKKEKKFWADMFGDVHGGEPFDLDAINKARMSENKWRLLLEELYSDKKYFDYARKSSAGRRVERDVNQKSGEGLDYLYGRARYWDEQPPVHPRPGSHRKTSTPRTPHGYVRPRNAVPRTLTPIKRPTTNSPETQVNKGKKSPDKDNNNKKFDESEC